MTLANEALTKTDLEKTDRMIFATDNSFELYELDEDKSIYRLSEDENYEATNSQLYFEESELMFECRIRNNRLTLTHKKIGVKVTLKKTETKDN